MLDPLAGGTPLLFLLIGAVAGSASIIGTALGLGRWMRSRYKETIGRRRAQSKQLRRLACGVRAEYIEEIVGEPAFLDKSSTPDQAASSEVRTYVLPDAFVRLYCTADSVVEAFAITTRSRRFAPALEIPWGGSRADKTIVRLGRTRYASLPSEFIARANGWAGARHWGYHESHYLGNPGYYQTYILASNDVSSVGWPSAEADSTSILSLADDGEIDTTAPPAAWIRFRTIAAPNTFCVVGPHVDADRFAPAVGVEADVLRVLPEE